MLIHNDTYQEKPYQSDPFESLTEYSETKLRGCSEKCWSGLLPGFKDFGMWYVPLYMALSLVFSTCSTNVVCVKTQQKHCNIKHHDKTKQ